MLTLTLDKGKKKKNTKGSWSLLILVSAAAKQGLSGPMSVTLQ